jgi:hypothetical protein
VSARASNLNKHSIFSAVCHRVLTKAGVQPDVNGLESFETWHGAVVVDAGYKVDLKIRKEKKKKGER